MFKVRVTINAVELTGLDALDERRRLGLGDASGLCVEDRHDPVAEVSEGFARLHFTDRTITDWSRAVRLSQLCPGDLVVRSGAYCHLNPDMPPERVRELWLAGTEVA